MSSLDHIGLSVSDFGAAKAFYSAALKPLGITLQMDVTKAETGDAYEGAGFGTAGKPFFWVGSGAHYHPTYYGAFVLDADGNNIEAVCHKPE